MSAEIASTIGKRKTAFGRFLRSAKVTAASVALALSFSSTTAHYDDLEPFEPNIKSPQFTTSMVEYSINACARSSYDEKNGWDIAKLQRIQDSYFEYLKAHWPEMGKNGVPKSILRLMPVINDVAKERKTDPYLIAGVIESESFGYKYAVSGRDMGLMQINEHNLRKMKEVNYENIFDYRTNIEMGTSILKGCIRQFNGDVVLALEAYNRGARRVRNGKISNDTLRYVERTLEHRKAIMKLVRE